MRTKLSPLGGHLARPPYDDEKILPQPVQIVMCQKIVGVTILCHDMPNSPQLQGIRPSNGLRKSLFVAIGALFPPSEKMLILSLGIGGL